MPHGGAGVALAGFAAPISAALVGPTSCERCPSPSSRQPNSEVLLESADRALIRQAERIRSHRLSNHDGTRTRRSPGLDPQAGAQTSLSQRRLRGLALPMMAEPYSQLVPVSIVDGDLDGRDLLRGRIIMMMHSRS